MVEAGILAVWAYLESCPHDVYGCPLVLCLYVHSVCHAHKAIEMSLLFIICKRIVASRCQHPLTIFGSTLSSDWCEPEYVARFKEQCHLTSLKSLFIRVFIRLVRLMLTGQGYFLLAFAVASVKKEYSQRREDRTCDHCC